MSVRRLVASYFFVQALAVLGWWLWLRSVPGAVGWFFPAGWPLDAVWAFAAADGVMIVGGSLVAAAVVMPERPPKWASSVVWALVAACWYPTLYCIGTSVLTGAAWLASGAMVCMSGLTLAMATVFGGADQRPEGFRVSRMPRGRALVWTWLQTAVFWGVFLGVLPCAVAEVEGRLGVSVFSHRGQGVAAAAFFLLASALGLWSGGAMAWWGKGTPLPTASAPELVVAGPYRFVRNPMALAGIVQGLAVGWWMGSVSVLLYAIAGGVVWHVAVRPAEEAELLKRFGERYAAYRRAVWLWVPRFHGRVSVG